MDLASGIFTKLENLIFTQRAAPSLPLCPAGAKKARFLLRYPFTAGSAYDD
jgi:hypothetical protein